MLRRIWLVLLLSLGVACASGDPAVPQDGGVSDDGGGDAAPSAGDFWSECTDHADCGEGYCYKESPEDETGHCTEECDGACPSGFACKLVQIAEGTDLRLCVPADENFCTACDANAECGDSTDFCISLSGGNFCSVDCSQDASVCPVGFTCQSVSGTGDTIVGMQCMPTSGICCIDADGDQRGEGGGCVTSDCDDSNPAVYDDAAEICDSYDNDCIGGADVDVEDCAEASCVLGAFGYVERAAEPCESGACTAQTASDCGLYTCAGGGETGDVCGTSCAGENDLECIPPAHCDASVCYDDLADGQESDENSDCEGDHSQNGYCCAFGDCCQVASDCPTFGTFGAICENPTTCQGTRGEAVCTTSFNCASTGTVQDDSACTSAVVANDCGFYLPINCTGATDQPVPSCPTSCSGNADCDADGFCDPDTNTCVEDLDDGEVCGNDADACKSGHCQNGFCCANGDCCSSETDCPAGYSGDPTCTVPSACQGDRDVAQCVDSVCQTSENVDDDSACTSGTLADNCGPYKPLFCDGNSVQPAPSCPTSCTSDLECDDNAYCSGGGACIPDEPDGNSCNDAGECLSGHCQNGFCCASGDCCAASNDCIAYNVPPLCNDTATCQGTRTDGQCNAQSQCVANTVGDDSGCSGLESSDCGPYPAQVCTASTSQSAPVCAGTCAVDGDCDVSAHCEGNECVPDQGQGGFCDEPTDCSGGLFCVDNVCCNSACNGSCEACDLATSVGTCALVPDGQDPDNECGAVDCSGFYAGFGGTGSNTCFERADVSAATATCGGSGTCRSTSLECGASGQGPAFLTCDDFCQDPTAGTCSGTTAGACTNVSQGNETCGLGVCQVTEARCVNGVPNTCTPNTGASSAETCNNIDDNCDGSIDNGSFSDSSEPNGSCASYTTLTTVGSNQQITNTLNTVYGFGDDDYYRINASETDNTCQCCDTFCFDEDYEMVVTLSVPAGAGSYMFCTASACGSVDDNCFEVLAGQSGSWVWTFDGGCPGSDDYSTFYRIYGDNAPSFECAPYTLQYSFVPGCF